MSNAKLEETGAVNCHSDKNSSEEWQSTNKVDTQVFWSIFRLNDSIRQQKQNSIHREC